mmetsp:Transcript_39421/g.80641  ORF Transcript_39421/g.80641 Transcript_39421/m.80641 type:complete len:90 (+) Transcript_39421:174-443(+)
MSSNLLSKIKTDLEKEVDTTVLSTLSQTGCVLTTDGWSDITNTPISNYVVVTPKKPTFLKSVDCSGHAKTGEYLANQLKGAVDETHCRL